MLEAWVERRRCPLELFLERLPSEHVLALGEVAEYVEVAEPVELAMQLAPALGVVASVVLRLGAECGEYVRSQLRVRLEVAHPVDELIFERFCFDDWLVAVGRVAAGRADVAADAGARAARPVHPRAAPLAVEELAQQVVLQGPAGLDDARAPGADLLHALEQLLRNERLVQPADGAVLAA
nr:hypothetical protein [Gaiella occulta]